MAEEHADERDFLYSRLDPPAGQGGVTSTTRSATLSSPSLYALLPAGQNLFEDLEFEFEDDDDVPGAPAAEAEPPPAPRQSEDATDRIPDEALEDLFEEIPSDFDVGEAMTEGLLPTKTHETSVPALELDTRRDRPDEMNDLVEDSATDILAHIHNEYDIADVPDETETRAGSDSAVTAETNAPETVYVDEATPPEVPPAPASAADESTDLPPSPQNEAAPFSPETVYARPLLEEAPTPEPLPEPMHTPSPDELDQYDLSQAFGARHLPPAITIDSVKPVPLGEELVTDELLAAMDREESDAGETDPGLDSDLRQRWESFGPGVFEDAPPAEDGGGRHAALKPFEAVDFSFEDEEGAAPLGGGLTAIEGDLLASIRGEPLQEEEPPAFPPPAGGPGDTQELGGVLLDALEDLRESDSRPAHDEDEPAPLREDVAEALEKMAAELDAPATESRPKSASVSTRMLNWLKEKIPGLYGKESKTLESDGQEGAREKPLRRSDRDDAKPKKLDSDWTDGPLPAKSSASALSGFEPDTPGESDRRANARDLAFDELPLPETGREAEGTMLQQPGDDFEVGATVEDAPLSPDWDDSTEGPAGAGLGDDLPAMSDLDGAPPATESGFNLDEALDSAGLPTSAEEGEEADELPAGFDLDEALGEGVLPLPESPEGTILGANGEFDLESALGDAPIPDDGASAPPAALPEAAAGEFDLAAAMGEPEAAGAAEVGADMSSFNLDEAMSEAPLPGEDTVEALSQQLPENFDLAEAMGEGALPLPEGDGEDEDEAMSGFDLSEALAEEAEVPDELAGGFDLAAAMEEAPADEVGADELPDEMPDEMPSEFNLDDAMGEGDGLPDELAGEGGGFDEFLGELDAEAMGTDPSAAEEEPGEEFSLAQRLLLPLIQKAQQARELYHMGLEFLNFRRNWWIYCDMLALVFTSISLAIFFSLLLF